MLQSPPKLKSTILKRNGVHNEHEFCGHLILIIIFTSIVQAYEALPVVISCGVTNNLSSSLIRSRSVSRNRSRIECSLGSSSSPMHTVVMRDGSTVSLSNVSTWEYVDPEKVKYPPVVEDEEDGYDSDDDYLPPDEGLKSRPRPLPAKTELVSPTTGETLCRTMRIPHCLRDNCFSVDVIQGSDVLRKKAQVLLSSFENCSSASDER